MAQRYKIVAEWIVGSLAEADRRAERLLDTGEVDTISITTLDESPNCAEQWPALSSDPDDR
ncbi:hypothetical protein AD006_29610 (plasmid) [Pseudonocardia sp. EC080610-09]|uniref:hypothetical protein n=1 Tax=unclassified Pseudonocardia TaxID=2619320 RepID=UPI000705A258|nr:MULTISPECIES: hypothetical protein [unclassified Pseudonocardia]ALL79424.1 hypothetical protein AD006_29610 [Pseudonocardia sp. EC080610-09]ALL85623.1 hypothetical protein AD017_31640 [Pseudonocardia sp. EC080619-01]